MTEAERNALNDLLKTPPRIVDPDESADAYMICSDEIGKHPGGHITNCSSCGKPVCFFENNLLAKKICPACAVKLMKSDANPEHCITPSLLANLCDLLFQDRRKN